MHPYHFDASAGESEPVSSGWSEKVGPRGLALVRAAPCLLLALVVLRSWVFVRYLPAHFDSDQAVFGLMGQDLVAGRAIPMFMYGQTYLLAVSVWLCAPLFALFGANITTLKLPMLLMNLLVVGLLWRGLRRESGVGAAGAAVAILPFALPDVIVSSRLIGHQGGNIEPFVFVLLAFFLRNRAVLLGLVLGVGFLNREFSLIGFVALLIMDVVEGQWRPRLRARLTSAMCLVATAAALRFVAAHVSTSYYGRRACVGRPRLENILGFFQQQLPTLIGGGHRKLQTFNITSDLQVGHPTVYIAAIFWLIILFLVLVWRRPLRRSELGGMSSYLVLVGLGQAAAFVLLSPSGYDVMLVRYVLLALLAWVGLVAVAWRIPALRLVTLSLILLTAGSHAADHVRLLHEYARGAPLRPLDRLAPQLLARGVHYLNADYWTSFDLAWQTRERIIASPPPGHDDRMVRYRELVAQHPNQVYTLADGPCRGGERLLRWYLCPPHPGR